MMSLARKLGILGARVDAKIRETEADNAERIAKDVVPVDSSIDAWNNDLPIQDQDLRSLFAKFDVPWEGKTAQKIFALALTRLEQREHRTRRMA